MNEPKPICPLCKKPIFANQEMERDSRGRQCHPACIHGPGYIPGVEKDSDE